MPDPKKYQEKNEFMGICVPHLVGEGKGRDEAIAACDSMWDRRDKTSVTNKAHIFAINYRTETKGGIEYLVVPGVPVREQVMNTYWVPASSIQASVNGWNGTAISIHHPKKNGGSVNVPEPDVAIIGRFYNARWDADKNQMVGEYWINIPEASKWVEGQAIVNAIRGGKILETSTGYYAEDVESPGEFNGHKYLSVHANLLPDHIAILPDAVGACSVKDGCGVNRNQVIHNCECDCPFKNAKNYQYEEGHLPRQMLEPFALNKGIRTPEQLEGLRSYMKEQGKRMRPVMVMRMSDGTLRIIDGNHRVSLAGEYGIDQIPVKLFNEDLAPIDLETAFVEWLHTQDQGYLNRQTQDPLQANEDPDLKTKHKESNMKLDIKGLIAHLAGMGVTVQANEKLEEFEVEETKTPVSQPALTDDEIASLKGFAALATKLNGIGPDALMESLAGLKEVPAAIKLAKNLQEREEADRATVIVNIKADPANTLTDEELKAMPMNVLNKLAVRSEVNFAGIGGGAFFLNEETDVLLPVHLKEEA